MILGPDLSYLNYFAHSMVNMGTSLCGNLGGGVFVNDFVWVNGGWVKGSRNGSTNPDTQGHFLPEMTVHPGFHGLVPILLELVHKYLYGFYTIPLML